MKPACARVWTSFSPLGVLRSGGGILREAHLKTIVEMVACCASSSNPPCATLILNAKSVKRSSMMRFLANIARYTAKPAALSRKKNITEMSRELILVFHFDQAPDGDQRQHVHHERRLQNHLTRGIMEKRVGISRLDYAEGAEHDCRQHPDHDSSHARLRGERPDLHPKTLPDAHDFR